MPHLSFAAMPPMHILVTGGQGMLGQAFAHQIQAVLPQCVVKAPGKDELDVRDAAQLKTWTDWVQGGWIVHCAALVDVEGCVREPVLARSTIVDGTRNVLDLAKAAQARVLYPQSFLIYSGLDNPIPESETPQPLALYGQLKLEGQRLVTRASADHLVVCMAGFFGGEGRDKNFVGRFIPHMRGLIDKGVSEFAVGDRIWQPTWTEDLARNALTLMAANKSGFYQMACHGSASFYELTRAIVAELGWQDVLKIIPVDAASVTKSELGKRPDKAVLSCQRLRDDGLDLQQDWHQALKTYLASPYFDSFRQKVTANDLSYS